MPPLPSPDRILVIMLRRIGDVLLTTPAVRALRKLYPHAQIDFLTEPPCHEILVGNPDLDQVLLYEKPSGRWGIPGVLYQGKWALKLRKRRYDWVIDFMGNPRSAALTRLSRARIKAGPAHITHRWAYNTLMAQSKSTCYAGLEKIRMLRTAGILAETQDFLPRLEVPKDSGTWAAAALKALGTPGQAQAPWIGFFPASRRATRQWPPEHFAELGRILKKQLGARILVFWGPGEEALARGIAQRIGPEAKISPKTSHLMDLAALISQCRLIVTNCNGPKHISVACKVPTLTIHGSSDPDSWNPPDDKRYPFVRKSGLICIACRLNECPYHMECMKKLLPQTVASTAVRLFEDKGWEEPRTEGRPSRRTGLMPTNRLAP